MTILQETLPFLNAHLALRSLGKTLPPAIYPRQFEKYIRAILRPT
jgi:hypothetical protein